LKTPISITTGGHESSRHPAREHRQLRFPRAGSVDAKAESTAQQQLAKDGSILTRDRTINRSSKSSAHDAIEASRFQRRNPRSCISINYFAVALTAWRRRRACIRQALARVEPGRMRAVGGTHPFLPSLFRRVNSVELAHDRRATRSAPHGRLGIHLGGGSQHATEFAHRLGGAGVPDSRSALFPRGSSQSARTGVRRGDVGAGRGSSFKRRWI